MAKVKPIRTLTNSEAKIKYKGKTITLKENDDNEKTNKIFKLKKENKIKLLYTTDINDITNWVYEYIK